MVMVLLMVIYLFVVYPLSEYFLGNYLREVSVWYILPLWLIANGLDCHSTIQFLKTKKVQEANFIINFFVKCFGRFWGPIIGKTTLVGLVTSVLLTPGTRVALFSWTVIIFVVSMNNYRLYQKYKEPV